MEPAFTGDVEYADRGEFEQTYLRNYSLVFGYLRARLLDGAWAEDLSQEVFLRAYNAYDRFDATRESSRWLLGIARNVLREHIRKLKRRKEITWAELILELEDTLEEEGVDEEMMRMTNICLSRVGSSGQQAIEMHYRQGLKMEQIAHRLHKTTGAVKVLMVRVRQALRRCLESQTGGGAP
ncbi:MAG: RNA polymerase sigma factor [Planctomycetes bacterium]|nr:RNA polymerase sigma factor [Planctomycetota bacterium]